MNAKEKKLLKIFLKENIKKMLAENPSMLTEQGFWDSISSWFGSLGQQDQQLAQNVQRLTQQVEGLVAQNQELGRRLQALERAAREPSTLERVGQVVGGAAGLAGGIPGAIVGSRLGGGAVRALQGNDTSSES